MIYLHNVIFFSSKMRVKSTASFRRFLIFELNGNSHKLSRDGNPSVRLGLITSIQERKNATSREFQPFIHPLLW